VAAENFAFVPSEVTIKVGDSVRWSLVSGAHTTTSGNPDFSWDQTITADTPVVVTFDQAGDFIYFCSFHGDQMSGRVVVEP
jgi:plastocyanin